MIKKKKQWFLKQFLKAKVFKKEREKEQRKRERTG